ncbi:hypothetical protein HPP92_009528 [Vanilla planifolia]|uniref:U1-type domain-containing protein n=1 Tax=Vanilla planifolia TaxID=51239 RepID=A0A835V7H9_VANPL|nr:hypothetical protein HPP92_009528 [Vanilla planifolia]
MVWFQCEDCGENLKKPKLANHFRLCSALKLSCIDCGEVFGKDTVQNHMQCMTEAEKYGPKSQGNPSQNTFSKKEKPKKNADVDINVGLSSRPPWYCSLCNTPATSKQTLLLHADGKKHRAKAKAYHSSHIHSSQTYNGINGNVDQKLEKIEANGSKVDQPEETNLLTDGSQQLQEKKSEKKRRHEESAGVDLLIDNKHNNACNITYGEGVKAEQTEERQNKRNKNAGKIPDSEHVDNNQVRENEALMKNIKWKKLVTSILKSNAEGAMKIKKLQKLVIKELENTSTTGDRAQLCAAMMEKINSSSRFVINHKLISLLEKPGDS